MFLDRSFLQILMVLFCLACKVSAADRIELVIDEKLTLEDVFKAGFRPSSVTPSNMGDVRVWDRQAIDLLFGDYRFSIDSEHTTFTLYDDDQIASLRIIGSREAPLTIVEAEKRARSFSDGLGLKAGPQIDEWLSRCRARNSMVMQGFGGKDWRPGIRVGGEFLTTLQQLDQSPAVLGIEIRWKYLGTGPAGGDRWGKPIVSPPGYDWDMSHEAWSARVRQGGAKPPGQPQPTPPDANPDAPVETSQKSAPAPKKPEVQKGPANPETGSPGWIIPAAGLILLGILALLFKARKRNSQ